ncbi:MAG: RNA methyltransferase [Candidatus Cloacimonadota bacterium]|nr:RNA methyltransferase [Candidatus Cloacimonadota bacterium]
MNKLSKNNFKELCKLKQKKYRVQTGKVIIEGKRLIEQLLKNGKKPAEIFLSAPVDFPIAKDIPVWQAAQWQIDKLTDSQNAQTIAALFIPQSLAMPSKYEFVLYLDDIKNPGNLGSIVRTAAAADLDAVVISENSCELFNPKVIRASMGMVFQIPIITKNWNWLQEQSAQIITTSSHDAQNVFQFQPQKPLILVIGSEAFGINSKIENLTNARVKIPTSNKIESLNAAAAAAVTIFTLKNKIRN